MTETPDREALHTALLGALAQTAGRAVETISETTTLDELEIDSLGLAGLILDIEDALDCELPAGILARLSDARDLTCVADLSAIFGWSQAA